MTTNYHGQFFNIPRDVSVPWEPADGFPVPSEQKSAVSSLDGAGRAAAAKHNSRSLGLTRAVDGQNNQTKQAASGDGRRRDGVR